MVMDAGTDESPLRKTEHVHAIRVGDEIILFDENTEKYYGLGGAAEVVWEQLHDGDTVQRLLGRIEKEYDLNQETKGHILTAIDLMTQAGVLNHASG